MGTGRNVLILFLGIAAILTGNFVGHRFFGENSAPSPNTGLASVLTLRNNLELGSRSKETGCKISGPLPDPACTPGAVFPNMTPEEICVSGYTQTVRNVSAGLKKKVYAEYDLTYPQPAGTYEADHLIPLELGGNNDVANLFPEAASPVPGFHEKDLVENFLHDEVCAGGADLISAQNVIASDWTAVWASLTPEQVQNLKTRWMN